MIDLLADHTELFKQFSDNPSFKKWLGDTIFGVTYQADLEIAQQSRVSHHRAQHAMKSRTQAAASRSSPAPQSRTLSFPPGA